MPATPVGNGEHAAAKAEAAKAKAEAAALAAQRREGESLLAPLTKAAKAAAGSMVGFLAKADESQHVLGRTILAVETVLESHPALNLTIRKWCEANIPAVSGPVYGSSPAYRALCAARVIALDPSSATLSVDAAGAAHRVRNTRGAVPKVLKAAKAKAKANGSAVTASIVSDVLADLYPREETGTPGPAKGSPKAANGAKAKAAKAPRNTPTETMEKPDLAVSGTRLRAAATRVGSLFGTVSDEDRDRVYAVAALIVGTCEDYGTAATRAALSQYTPKAKAKAAKRDPQPKAKANTRNTRNTAKATA